MRCYHNLMFSQLDKQYYALCSRYAINETKWYPNCSVKAFLKHVTKLYRSSEFLRFL